MTETQFVGVDVGHCVRMADLVSNYLHHHLYISWFATDTNAKISRRRRWGGGGDSMTITPSSADIFACKFSKP